MNLFDSMITWDYSDKMVWDPNDTIPLVVDGDDDDQNDANYVDKF